MKSKKFRLGKNMVKVLEFANTSPGWHSYVTMAYSTVQAIRLLEKHGLVEKNKFLQFRKALK